MRVRRALGAAFVLVGLLLVATSTATAQQALPPLVTDYSNYPDTPQALLTDGCDFTGVTEASFTLNGGAPVGGLSDLPGLQAGDTVTMSWTGVTPACVGSAISLAVKDAPQPFFDPNVDQPTPPGGYNVTTLTDGPGSVSLTMPDLSVFSNSCNYQLDAIVGVPLAVVGPSGSFYSAASRGDDRRTTLISFRNGSYSVCAAQTTSSTTSTTSPTSTTSTTIPTTPPTTAPPTSTTNPPSSPPTTTAPAPTTAAAASAQAVQAVQAQRTLAATGTTPTAALAGTFAVGLGALLLVAGRRRRLTD